MGRRSQKITVTTVGIPPLEGAEAFARWMAAVLNKQTDPGPGRPDASKTAPKKDGGSRD